MTTYLLAWIPMLLLAVANGIFREAVIKKRVSDATAHRLSTFTLMLLLAFYLYFILQRFPPATAMEAIVTGATWMVLTLLFEFGLGFLRGMTWPAMLADYNLLKGRLWVMIPLFLLLFPYVFYLIRANC